MRQEVPASLEMAVERALQMDPGDRFQTAAELRDVLLGPVSSPSPGAPPARRQQLWAGARAHPALAITAAALVAAAVLGGLRVVGRTPQPASGAGDAVSSAVAGGASGVRVTPEIAVLVLDDLSPNGDHGALATGITAELIRRLGEGGLRVPSLQAVKPLEQRKLSLDSLRKVLGVDLVVHGSVTPLGPRLRVALDLLDAKTGLQLESARREAPAESVTVLLDGVSLDLASVLRKRLGREFRVRELRTGTRSDSAWLLVWGAEELREQREKLTLAGDTVGASALLQQADSLLVAAEARDPRWTDPIVQRGWVARDRGLLATASPGVAASQWARTALEHAEKALVLDRHDAAALELRGTARFDLAQQVADSEQVRLFEGARQDLEQAVHLDPARPRAWKTLSELLYEFPGEFQASYDAALRAQQEDRFLREDRDVVFRLAQASLDLQRYDEAITWARQGRRSWPDAVEFPAVELAVLASSPQTADVGRAWAVADTILQFASPQRRDLFRPIYLAQVAAVLGHAGRRDSARAVLRRAVEAAGRGGETVREYAAYDIAHAWLVVGDRDQSLEWLALDLRHRPYKRAYHARDHWFAALRDDPRFRELVQLQNGPS
jgi:TolB-like protein